MSRHPCFFVAVLLIVAASAVPVQARGINDTVNGAKYYGPVYGWRYYPPPAAAPEPACAWTTVQASRNGHAVTRRVRRCS